MVLFFIQRISFLCIGAISPRDWQLFSVGKQKRNEVNIKPNTTYSNSAKGGFEIYRFRYAENYGRQRRHFSSSFFFLFLYQFYENLLLKIFLTSLAFQKYHSYIEGLKNVEVMMPYVKYCQIKTNRL